LVEERLWRDPEGREWIVRTHCVPTADMLSGPPIDDEERPQPIPSTLTFQRPADSSGQPGEFHSTEFTEGCSAEELSEEQLLRLYGQAIGRSDQARARWHEF
jgi:hypothetical protein